MNRFDSSTGFTIQYPKKDWQQPLFGTGSALAVLWHKSREVTVAIEHRVVPNILTPDEINDDLAGFEIKEWQRRRSAATGFGHSFLTYDGVKMIVLDFTQPSPRGTERVRLYNMPRGRDWYRVICTATEATFEKYRLTCHDIAMSFGTTTPK